ncbi:hypothetical protein BpHYR1_036024 [Brachionus plicatilis]|uniref:Uncharacterized protein n=1 Tax=Brachionus plicatilis TaxID=10195 RepID=A0A3M7SXT5_BRAPC|nr:hypothetical protein BpHYR1_036024 [Brachionus plicatilis]
MSGLKVADFLFCKHIIAVSIRLNLCQVPLQEKCLPKGCVGQKSHQKLKLFLDNHISVLFRVAV